MKIRNNRLGSHFYCDNLIESSGKESLKEIHLQKKDRRWGGYWIWSTFPCDDCFHGLKKALKIRNKVNCAN